MLKVAITLLALGSTVLICADAGAEDFQAKVVKTLPSDQTAGLYVANRAPLAASPLIKLPNGAIEPRGWLDHILKLEANGMGGKLEEISPFLKYEGNGWVDPDGKGGWEELGYWLKGYGDLGYALKDQAIIAHTRKWIDGITAAQQPDGFFGPTPMRTALDGKPDMWPHMPVLNAMQSYYEFTGDPRVIKFMTNYFKWQNTLPADYFSKSWQDTRFGDNIESIYWLYNRTGEAWLLELPPKMHEHSAKWYKGIANFHNVNFSQGFREPAEYWQQKQDPQLLQATEDNYEKMMDMYGQFPGGGFAGDENCRPGYTDPRQGFETCGIVELMHSFEMLTKIDGNPLWMDRCEYIAFNSLPAALTPDLKALHYLTSANSVQLDKQSKHPDLANGGTMISYSPYEVYRCCQHNHTMGWPYYAEHLFLATADKGICAALYSASSVEAKVGDGSTIKIEEETNYPFAETVSFKISTAKPAEFPLYLRVPQWCNGATVKVNDQPITAAAQPLSYIQLNRKWSDGDRITLELPMHIATRYWFKNQHAVSVDRGPLTYALAIKTKWIHYGGKPEWPEYEVYAASPWNYGLVLPSGEEDATAFQVIKHDGPLADQPFTPETTPIELKATGRKIEAWQEDKLQMVGKLQPSPVKSDQPDETLRLIPMGAARLRISSFPTIATVGPGHVWTAPLQATASFSHSGDSLDALSEPGDPSNSNDNTIQRFTWWDHKGSAEWVQYDLPAATTISSVDVYWFDDTGVGQCRVPRTWKLLYKDGEAWKPVEAASDFSTAKDQYNHVKFTPVQTNALRVDAQLQPGVSGGILRWRCNKPD